MSTDPYRLDVNSPVPLYHQLARLVREQIRRGLWKPGGLLPSEEELQARAGVSRATVRQALNLLVQEELIERRRGRGTFVRAPVITRSLPGLTSFSEEMRAAGRRPRSRLLHFEEIQVPLPKLVELLRLGENEGVVYLRRLRSADDMVLGISASYLPFSIWETMAIDPSELNDASLYHFIETRTGLQIVEAEETVRTHPADVELAREIQIPVGFPVVELERLVFGSHGQPVEFGVNLFRADHYQLRIHHRRVRNSGIEVHETD